MLAGGQKGMLQLAERLAECEYHGCETQLKPR
jgi:hypothetical protein